MSARRFRMGIGVFVCAMVSLHISLGVEDSVEAVSYDPTTLPGSFTLGVGGDDEAYTGYADFLMPLWADEEALLFFAPRLSTSDASEEEINLGIGYRRLLESYDLILGGNLYYDSRWTAYDNRFDQYGAGLEALSRWFDARCNYYWPEDDRKQIGETTRTEITESQTGTGWGDIYARGHGLYQNYSFERTKTTSTYLYRRYEEAMEGYDMEVGVKIPYIQSWAEARLFLGYQDFEGNSGEHFDGVKGRAEFFAMPGLIIDAEVFENEDLNGSDFYVGVRVNLPFDITELLKGGNPFAGSSDLFTPGGEREFSDRLSEMVRRDPKIRTQASDWEMIPEATEVQVEKTGSGTATYNLMNNITFVGPSAPGAQEDGTHEAPYSDISNGVAHAQSPVYVMESGEKYIGNVVLEDNVDLIGAGTTLVGQGGKTFGGKTHPVLEAKTSAPAITIVGNDVTVKGLDIRNPHNDGGKKLTKGPDSRPGIGIVVDGATRVEISDNLITAAYDGVYAGNYKNEGFTAKILNNIIQNCGNNGMVLNVETLKEIDLDISGQFNNNQGSGLYMDLRSEGPATVSMNNLTASGNHEEGIDGFVVETSGDDAPVTITLNNVMLIHNGSGTMGPPLMRAFSRGSGLYELEARSSGDRSPVMVSLSSVNASENREDGVQKIDISTGGDQSPGYLRIENSSFNRNVNQGIDYATVNNDDGEATIEIQHIQALGNGEDGIHRIYTSSDGRSNIRIADSVFNQNQSDGINQVYAYSYEQATEITLSGITASQNHNSGIMEIHADSAGTRQAAPATVTIKDSQFMVNRDYGLGEVRATTDGNDSPTLIDLQRVTANDNDDDGIIRVRTESQGNRSAATTRLQSVTTISNRVDGLYYAEAFTHGDQSPTLVTLQDSQFNQNGDNGIDNIAAYSSGEGSASAIEVTQVQFMGNRDKGVSYMESETRGSSDIASISLNQVEARQNDDNGLGVLWANTDTGPAVITLNQVNASDNRLNGIQGIDAQVGSTTAVFSVSIADSKFTGNGRNGASLDNIGNGSFLIRSSVFANNSQSGLWIDAPGGPVTRPIVYNAGDAVAGTAGYNSFYGNGVSAISVDSISSTIKAENNWWGGNRDPFLAGQIPSEVDADPWLSTDPNL